MDGAERMAHDDSMSFVSPFEGGAGTPIGPAARPADARLQAADALLDKQQLLSEAQRIAHFGSWWQDRSGRLVWSDEMYRILGVVPQQFTPSADSLPALIHPDDRAEVRERVAAAFAGGVVAEFEFRVLRPDGSERW
ncbi:MAG: PAS domain-containing protein, partial [Burkholderiaceae bacterium]